MRSSVALVAFFSIALLACFTEARKDPRGILRLAASPGALTESLFLYPGANSKEEKLQMKDFESKPESFYIYRSANSKEEKLQMKDFESKPESLYLYRGANSKEEKLQMKDFKSKPESLYLYRGDKANLQEGKPHI